MKKIGLMIFALMYASILFASSGGIVSVGLLKSKKDSNLSMAVIDVIISNNTDENVKVLKWNTPLENEIKNDLFDITINKEKVRYIGKMVKRGTPTESDYLTFQPKESKVISVKLSDYYDMSREGYYNVTYKRPVEFKFVKKKIKINKTKIKEKSSTLKNTLNIYYIPNKNKNKNNEKQPAQFDQCTQTRIDVINAAHNNAIIISKNAALAMNNAERPTSGRRYVEWFGSSDVSRHDTVQNHFNSIYSALETKDITFACDCQEDRTYAYVNPNVPYVIHLCNAFWSALGVGTDSKAGTIVHEMSHFTVVADTDDFAYGQTRARELARTDPDSAVKNADSHEYFAENTPSLSMGNGTNGSAIRQGFNAHTLQANDDSSTDLVPIGFTLNFFGYRYSSLYVNNNGNITFGSALSEYTPFDLTSTRKKIIAPFFADVDTRNSAVVTYGQGTVNGRLAFGVNWVNVGFFNEYNNPVNSFQLILIDRSDTGSGNFDIEFNYNHIGWEAGTASGASSSGLGGYSARVGFSNGTGVSGTYYEMPGSAINGAFVDGGSHSLVTGKYNSTANGRYIFRARDGYISTPPIFTLIPILYLLLD